VPLRPPFFAFEGGFCGCRGLGMCTFSALAVGFMPFCGRFREKSGIALLLFFFMEFHPWSL